MKKRLFLPLAATLILGTFTVQQVTAQNSSPYWSIYGNTNATGSQKLGTYNTYPLRIITNNSTRIYIGASNGYVGIGTTSPSSRLHINTASGTSPFKAQINGSTKLYVSSGGGLSVGSGSSAPTNGLYVAGNVGIGTNVPAYKLQVMGTSSFSNQLTVGDGGVYGYNSGGPGVYASGSSYGVYATSPGFGVYGNSSAGSYGVYGNSSYIGVYGQGGSYGVRGYSSGGWGVWGQSSSSIGVYGSSSSNYGVYGYSSTYPAIYAYGAGHYGVEAHSGTTWGVTAYGVSGVYGQGSTGYGVYGTTSSGTGVYGFSNSATGVYGASTNALGGYFYSTNSYGIRAATGRSDKNWAGVFDGNVYAFGAFQTSDKNLKKNITDFSDAMSIIDRLKPKSYEFRNDGKLAAMHLPQGKHYGLIAQDLEPILPNLVKNVDADISEHKDLKDAPEPTATTAVLDPKSAVKQSVQAGTQKDAIDQTATDDKMTIKSVNYIELIPIIIKGMQEQSELIKQQQQQINDLKDQISRLSGNSNILTSAGTLGQNSPNPVRNTTRISYSVPNNSRAQLLLTDALGKTIKVLSLNNAGYVNLNATGLSSGMYNYSLMIDGKIVESKKMEVVR